MSVLIKGMKMPNGCKDCVFVKRGSVYDICPLLRVPVDYDVEFGGSPSNCPLIELSDHGDLVDRDAFIKVHREYLCTDCVKRKGVKNGRMRILYEIGGVPCRACGVEDMFEYLDDAPVVIPAERSEDGET